MNSPKFIHIRSYNVDGSVCPRGGITIAYIIDGNSIYAAEALCHPNDNFNKHIGRAKAAGRLKSDKYRFVYPLLDGETVKEAKQRLISELS